MELNYLYFETDSDDFMSDEDFMLWKSLFYFKQFSIVQTSEGFSIRGILYRKTHCVFQNKEFLLTETFVLNLCNFNIAENVNIAGTAFWQKYKYLRNFQF